MNVLHIYLPSSRPCIECIRICMLFFVYKFLEKFGVNFPSTINLFTDKIINFHRTIPQLKKTAGITLMYILYIILYISSIYTSCYPCHLIMCLCIHKSKHQVINNFKDEGTTMGTRASAMFSGNST